MPSNICRAKYRWTREELVKAMRHHQRLKIRRAILVIMQIFSVVLLGLIGLSLVMTMLVPATSWPPFWSTLILSAFSLYWLIFDRVNAWYWSRGFLNRPDANLEFDWQLSENDITVQSALGTATVTWKSFFKIVETSEGFLFYPVNKIFYWLPFAALESPECVARVRQLIADYGY